MLNKKKITTLVAVLSLFALVGCDEDEYRYPSNYDKPIFTEDSAMQEQVSLDTYKQYYANLTSSDAVYEKTVEKINMILADKVHNYDAEKNTGSPVYNITNDVFEDSVYAAIHEDNGTPISENEYTASNVLGTATGNSNLLKRSEDSLLSTAKGGSYDDDNLFIEKDYAQYLYENYYYINDFTGSTDSKGKLVVPGMEYKDVFTQNENYNKYMEEELYKDMKVNYLTAEYIYNKSYSSIGNSNARNVQIISLADRSDEPGDAKHLLDAYVNDFIYQKYDLSKYTKANAEFFRDDDFHKLERMWKGITKDYAAQVDSVERYANVVLSDAEEEWLTVNGVLTADVNNDGTLVGKIKQDTKKLNDGLEDWIKLDASLESSYTGSYTYNTTVGIRKAVDDIAKRSFITKGWYLKSAGISSLPSTLSDRIFSPKVSTSEDTVGKMAKEPGTRKDLTVFEPDGYRYMTVADTITGDDTSGIVYYDSSAKTYYITRMLDVVDTNALSKTATDSIYGTGDTLAKQQVARTVAYVMSTTGSYKTSAEVYWFSRLNWNFFDSKFLDYLKSNYKDIFKDENPYEKEDKISLITK